MAEKSILIIDDDPNCVELTRIALEKTGKYRIFSESDSRKGVGAAIKSRPDLILLDIVMPAMSGLDVLEKLKKNTKTMHIPVIMISSLTDQCSKLETSRFYGECYLEKPLKPDFLVETIDRMFRL